MDTVKEEQFDIVEQKPKIEALVPTDISNSKKRSLSGDNDNYNIKRSKLHNIIQQLRNEEANLLILKRLRSCQVASVKTNGFYQHNSSTTNNNTATRIPQSSAVVASKNPHPLPLFTDVNQSRSPTLNNTNHQAQSFRKQQPPPPVPPTSTLSVMNNKPQLSSRQQASLPTTKNQLVNNYQQQLTTNSNNNTNRVSSYTLEQRMTAAKIALRKQLERQLLDIPSPKPLLQDILFIPNPSSFDFQMFQGLEDVLQCLSEITIVEKENLKRLPQRFTDRAEILDPFVCSQCKTDWTTRWWKNDREDKSDEDKDDVTNILCDRCTKQVIRRSSKTEHSALLKNVFVSAMEQERDIEKNFNTLIRQQQQQKTVRNTNNIATRNHIPTPPSSNHRLPSRSQSPLVNNTNQRAKITQSSVAPSQFATKLSQQQQINRKSLSLPKQPINHTSLQHARQPQMLQSAPQQQRHSHSARPVQSMENNQRQLPQSANRQNIPHPQIPSLLQRQQQQQQQQQMQTMKTAVRRSFPANM